MADSMAMPLADRDPRREAGTALNRFLLVEAGAGSGKTAILAGRTAMMLAEGVPPQDIAAVTFTELAASELLSRVRGMVEALACGHVPAELQDALPCGISERQRGNLAEALTGLDEIVCSTIHGFCQRLVKSYPAEADVDPGAEVMDQDQADRAFGEIAEAWLRDELDGDADPLLAELAQQEPEQALGLVRTVLAHLRRHPALEADAGTALPPLADAFGAAAKALAAFLDGSPVREPETGSLSERFSELAETLASGPPLDGAQGMVRLLALPVSSELATATGPFRKYMKKGKWSTAAKGAGLSAAEGARLNDAASQRYSDCCAAWKALRESAASHVLAGVVTFARPAMLRWREYKRSSAVLDFDDLIFGARNLLRDHGEVRQALAGRFPCVLVDEFQDTDPLQTEIFWRLCGDPPPGGEENDREAPWENFRIRPGALFLVGDPKQAIYRFRGADVQAYLRARSLLQAQDPGSVLSISTNFRSRESILRYVNDRFADLLSEEAGQPGFTALDAFRGDGDGPQPRVAALDIAVDDGSGRIAVERLRDAEADAVATLCARLIGNTRVPDDREPEGSRTCKPGDIALLAPTGTDLWRYEEALERNGIPVASQAGKRFFQRQEVQDLVALTRALADRRDTLALGALLRGPLVGFTEEELLDIAWELPREENSRNTLPRLSLGIRAEAIRHPRAREVLERLQALHRRSHATAPWDLLSQAVEELRVRPILLQRHRGQAERALANVDRYLEFSRAYTVRGLRAFADAMADAWAEESRAAEGRPDAREEAVALYTMHAAKGLEWPIVVPVNAMTQLRTTDATVVDRDRLYCPVLGIRPAGCEAALEAEKAELGRERIRLWYVALTRARECLVLPRFDVQTGPATWMSLPRLPLGELSAFECSTLDDRQEIAAGGNPNGQTREEFALEAAAIAARQHRIVWTVPSRSEGPALPSAEEEAPEIWIAGSEDTPEEAPAGPAIRGGRERGIILHRLIEETLTGETSETEDSLAGRAAILIGMAGRAVAADPAEGLEPRELARCVLRALSLPEIAALRPDLQPEFPVHAATAAAAEESVASGIADAVAFDADGAPYAVVDWKSDVLPAPATLEHYRAQVRAYLHMTGASLGLIVLATSGTVIRVKPEIASRAA